mmetsp:Transcript_30987/g.73007  ORF Transcript_30987/g.73007 Transcript_30987/m.73007 type:complete len:225 (+) Transcript_30987:772-1446(+)
MPPMAPIFKLLTLCGTLALTVAGVLEPLPFILSKRRSNGEIRLPAEALMPPMPVEDGAAASLSKERYALIVSSLCFWRWTNRESVNSSSTRLVDIWSGAELALLRRPPVPLFKPCAELAIATERCWEGDPLNIEEDPLTELDPAMIRFVCGRSHKMREARSMLPEALRVQFLREFRLVRDDAAAAPMRFLPVQTWLPFWRPLTLLFRLLGPLPPLLPKLSCCAS